MCEECREVEVKKVVIDGREVSVRVFAAPVDDTHTFFPRPAEYKHGYTGYPSLNWYDQAYYSTREALRS